MLPSCRFVGKSIRARHVASWSTNEWVINVQRNVAILPRNVATLPRNVATLPQLVLEVE
jgi:hypothetical protein